MIHVLGASMPRSGHHLFVRMLEHTLNGKFSYCEFYGEGCCKSIPCSSDKKSAGGHAEIFMQKSHDWQFNDPISVPDTFRVIQYRSPVPRTLSNYELHVRNTNQDTLQTFRSFLVTEALYYERFYKKWLVNRPSEFMLLSYEELTSDPIKAARDFFKYVGMPVDLDTVVQGVEKAVRVSGGNKNVVQQNIYAHRYANQPVLANFESIVLRNCPGYYPTRYFSAGDSSKSLIGLLHGAKKALDAGDRVTAISLAEEAQRHDPEEPLAKRVLRQAMKEGGTGGAKPGPESEAPAV